MSEVGKKYTHTGILRFIQNGELECYRTEESITLQDCMKCCWYNGFRRRTHPRFNDHVFCQYKSDEEIAYEEAIKHHKCPTCGDELTDHLIKNGSHKGHGRIVCLKCKKVIVII